MRSCGISRLISDDFLCQGIFEVDTYEETEKKLEAITGAVPAPPTGDAQ